MASERDFELLDDYIGNRLSDADKASFESRLQADPDLQRELKLQQDIVSSLRKARAAELKAMLNNIPPSAIPANSTGAFTWTAVAIAVAVAIGLYFYLQPSEETSNTPVADSVTVAPPAADQSADADVPSGEEQPVTPKEEPGIEKPRVSKERKSESTEAETPAAPGNRELNVFDPDAEVESEVKAPEVTVPANTTEGSAKASDIKSEIVSDHKNYDFHYQFREDKLILYGAFDKNLYSILEFFSENKRTIFLEYKNNFYLLNPAGEKVKPLSPVNDPALIRKLREH